VASRWYRKACERRRKRGREGGKRATSYWPWNGTKAGWDGLGSMFVGDRPDGSDGEMISPVGS